jgi:hypothetical protein
MSIVNQNEHTTALQLPELILVRQVAREQGRDFRTIRREIARGLLPGVRLGGRWFTSVSAVRERLAPLTREAATP